MKNSGKSKRPPKMRGFTPPLRKGAGFTLLELMVATGILTVVISGLLFTFVQCILLNSSNNNRVIAVNDAQRVLEQIRGLDFAQISSYSAPSFSNLENETLTVQTTALDSRLMEIKVDVNWTERQGQRNFQLTTRRAKTS